jgi:alkanesulfonate monooxygenase SsuD/methylene tetrahydromethanopterin reductase-like flavin-dependent oxidoreductase (luciferase family)
MSDAELPTREVETTMSDGSGQRARLGLNVRRARPAEAVELIRQAEAAGVESVWMTMGAAGFDTLTTFAVAAAQTERVTLGTSIVPAFTRHPVGLAGQVLAMEDIAPGRFRIGIGTSHGPQMRAYGVAAEDALRKHPLDWLREYLIVARTSIHDGKCAFDGASFSVDVTLPGTARTPALISALRPNAWELAGELSDGGISWLCPPDYLIGEARDAMRRGAERAGRDTPPLVAHVPVAFSSDLARVRAAAREQIGGYTRLPFYFKMFAEAGFPLASDGVYTDDLLDHLIVSGSDDQIVARLSALLDRGLDELLLMLIHIDDQHTEEQRLMRLIGAW